jgi:hypothetical protein
MFLGTENNSEDGNGKSSDSYFDLSTSKMMNSMRVA